MTILPSCLRAIIRRAISVAAKYAPLRLALMTASQSASVWSTASFSTAMPALLISTLTGPSAASALSIALPIEAVSVTSICTATARPPLPADLVLEAFQFGGLARRQHDRGAMRGQHARELPPQPLRGAGDENGFFTDVE